MARNVRAEDRGSEREAVAALRRRLAATAPRPQEGTGVPVLPTGVPALDQSLGGGLPRGRVAELIGRAGRLSCGLAALAAATAAGRLAALVDGPGALDPRAAADAGVELERLLWVRPQGRDRGQRARDALQAADLLLDGDAFALVTVYLCGLPPPRASAAAWLRLQQRAARAGAAVLLLADQALAGSFSAVTIELNRQAVRWRRAPGARLLLVGQELQLRVLRSRLGPPADDASLSLTR